MRYAIVGAGLAGLTVAHRLAERGEKEGGRPDVEILEADERIGGKLFTVPFEGGGFDVGGEAFLDRDGTLTEFFSSLGLADRIMNTSGLRSTVYTGGELKRLPVGTVMGIPAESSAVAHLVSQETARRIDAEGSAEPLDWQAAGDLSVGRMVRERYGDEVVDRCVTALLGGVYSCGADELGVRATVPQLAEAFDRLLARNEPVTLSAGVREALALKTKPASAGPKRAPAFGAFRDGYQELYERLAEDQTIYVDAFVSAVERDRQGRFHLTGAGEGGYDRVILATPAPTTARLLAGLEARAAAALGRIALTPSAVVGLRLDTDRGLPEASGVLVAADEPGLHAKAFTFSSRKWPHLAERGGAMIRASFGRSADDEAMRAPEDQLVDWALDDLGTVSGFDARAAGVAEIFVQRWFGGIPRYAPGHREIVEEVRAAVAEVPGLEVAGAWAGGVGVPAVIADAVAVADRVRG